MMKDVLRIYSVIRACSTRSRSTWWRSAVHLRTVDRCHAEAARLLDRARRRSATRSVPACSHTLREASTDTLAVIRMHLDVAASAFAWGGWQGVECGRGPSSSR